jgi:hypothetical protein
VKQHCEKSEETHHDHKLDSEGLHIGDDGILIPINEVLLYDPYESRVLVHCDPVNLTILHFDNALFRESVLYY